MSSSLIQSNLASVRQRISQACQRFSRDPAEIELLAVSKTKPAAMVIEALNYNQRHFGENYLQEALEKISVIDQTQSHWPVNWHFIGAIQSNKTRPIAEHFDWVHTIASLKVARRLNDQRPSTLPPLNVLLQVNLDMEPSKAGIPVEEVKAMIESMITFDNIRLRGLMAIPAPNDNPVAQRDAFRRLRELQESVKQTFDIIEFNQLSMGMTADLESAIAEGSTILRIGTAIFGTRE